MVQTVSNENFGLLIAYVIPGYLILLGVSFESEWIAQLLGQTQDSSPSIAGVLLLTIIAIAFGLVSSTMRWLIVDSFHHAFGLSSKALDFGGLDGRVDGFRFLVESHYRYYQFYGNCVTALPIALILRWQSVGFYWGEFLGSFLLWLLFVLATRDSIRKYYQRTEKLFA